MQGFQNVQSQPGQPQAQQKYKFPQAQQIIEAMKGNLAENMANPDAILAQQDARDAARADGGEQQQISPENANRIAAAKANQPIQ